MKGESAHVVCFGEVLWDNLPDGRKPGGAPLNVAYHLKKSGIDSYLISRVGNDNNGIDLLNELISLGCNTTYCQVDEVYPTSTVEVMITAEQEVKYDIVRPVAWDHITNDDSFAALLKDCGAFVFGSLAIRNSETRGVLNQLLDISPYNVFDVNLRWPHYQQNQFDPLLSKTNLLKLNVHELELIAGWYGNARTQGEKIKLLQSKFDIAELIITKGSKGASYYTGNEEYHCPAYKIQPKDTIGSGDAFLAAFLAKKLGGADAMSALGYAAAVSAFVTTCPGACPPYTYLDIDKIINQHIVNDCF